MHCFSFFELWSFLSLLLCWCNNLCSLLELGLRMNFASIYQLWFKVFIPLHAIEISGWIHDRRICPEIWSNCIFPSLVNCSNFHDLILFVLILLDLEIIINIPIFFCFYTIYVYVVLNSVNLYIFFLLSINSMETFCFI